MATVTIEVDRDDLPAHTDEQFEEWVKFCVGHRANIENDNPLNDQDLDAWVINVET